MSVRPQSLDLMPVLLGLALLAPAVAAQTITIDKAELRTGNELRLEGSNAVSNATITVNGTAQGSADDKGDFQFQLSSFQTGDCLVEASDGFGSATRVIQDCTPQPPLNQAPTAVAGADRTVVDADLDGSESVALDGTLSFDPDGTIVSHDWSKAGLTLATGPSPLVLLNVGVHLIDLTVTDDAGATATDSLVVTVNPGGVLPPTVDLVSPDSILESDQVFSGTFLEPLMGASVASAGDVNGDGFDDVIVGAPGWDTPGGFFDEGAAFVFLGGPGGIIGSGPSTAHAVIQSDSAGARFGSSVSSAGDINGDGYDDIIVGAPLHDASGLVVSGAAFVFHGGPLGITAAVLADADAVLESLQIEAHMGTSVAAAGDVNGDGFDDVIVGAALFGKPFVPPIPNQGSGRQGAAFVFLGSPTGAVGTDPATAQAQLVSWASGTPSQVSARFGQRVAGAGDVNGDGFDDVIIGCPSWNLARTWPGVPGGDPPEEGAAFVFLGGPTGVVGNDPTNAHARIESGQLKAFLGNSVGSAGDVNADGFGDIIVGAIGFPAGDPLLVAQEGAVFVFLGGPSGISATAPADAQAMFQGSELAEWIGQSVGAAGDVDGDGFGDVLFGARVYPGSLPNEGVAYVFRGGPSGVLGASLSHAYLRLVSHRAEALLGVPVASAGNVDGDLVPDFIVGVTGYSGGQDFEGAAFVFNGVPTPNPPNQPPIANAGLDQSVTDTDDTGFETLLLDGSASFDVDGTLVQFDWFDGAALVATGVQPSPSLSVGGHTLTLVVTDDRGATASDSVFIQVLPTPANQPPVANGGPDRTVTDTDGDGFVTLTVDGSASFDPDGIVIGYLWSEFNVTLGTTSVMQVTLPVGSHTLMLQVTDDKGATASDPVVIGVFPMPPVQQGDVAISGSTLVSRGDPVSWTVTLTNTGTAPLTNVQMSLGVSAGSLVKNLSPAGTVAIPDVPVGGSVTRTWNGQADKQGTATVTASVSSSGVSLGMASLQLTVVK